MPDPGRPEAGEYAEYYGTYVGKVPGGPIVETLEREIGETLALLRGVPEERAGHRYAPGKWSIREVVGHVADMERVFACRALQFARGEAQPLPGVDQDAYVTVAAFDGRTLGSLLDDLAAVRRASVTLFASLDEEAWRRRGTASGCAFTVRAMPWIIVGHERHHRGVLRQRYL